MTIERKRIASRMVSIFVAVAMMSAVSVWAKHNPKQGPKELNGVKFIAQDMDQAKKECEIIYMLDRSIYNSIDFCKK